MSFAVLSSLSFSIFIAGMLSIIRFKKINDQYYPFVLSLWIGCLNELISLYFLKNYLPSSINNNIYILIESILITFLFKNLGLFNSRKIIFYGIIVGFICEWLIENFILGQISVFNAYFSIFSSFVIVLMSISTINELIIRNSSRVFANATFLLCLGFIVFFTYQVLVYAFWIYGSQSDTGFLLNIFTILIYINLLTNLIYALAVLWMPKKLEFTLPY